MKYVLFLRNWTPGNLLDLIISPLIITEIMSQYQYLFQQYVSIYVYPICGNHNTSSKKISCKRDYTYDFISQVIAYTSVPFKCLERIVLKYILPESDSCQFSYRKKRSTEDATSLLNNTILENLDKKNTCICLVIVYRLSSPFNTLKPDIITTTLKSFDVSSILCKFILDFLINRKQCVRINDTLSGVITITTDDPQCCVLSVVLFIIYSNDLCSRFDNCLLIKYTDDAINVGLITNSDATNYKIQIDEVSQWCRSHNLLLNVAKTKAIIFDFRHFDITREHILWWTMSLWKYVKHYNYIGVTIDNKLTWPKNCCSCFKCKQRLLFLGLLNSFCVNNEILHIFYMNPGHLANGHLANGPLSAIICTGTFSQHSKCLIMFMGAFTINIVVSINTN